MSFWEKNIKSQIPAQQELSQESLEIDEETAQLMGIDPESDVFEEEEDDIQSLMGDANLRLEQGRLYQMVLSGDIFADTNADPRAIKNVQREIRKFVRDRMEIMLGIKKEQESQQVIVSSPFNDMEVTVLKMLASRMSKGESEKAGVAAQPVAPASPKKDGITSISGTVRPSPAPLVREAKPLPKAQPIKKSQGSAIKNDASDPKITKPIEQMTVAELDAFNKSKLTKPIDQMTPEELAAHDKATLEQRSRNYARMPTNLTPHPTASALEMLYANQAAQHAGPGTAVGNIMGMMNSRKP